jgi:hypothetical protein
MTTYFTEKPTNEMLQKAPVVLGWPRKLLFVSMGAFFGMIFLYVGVAFGYTAYLNSTLDKITKELETLGATVEPKTQQSFINFYSQIGNLNKLLKAHVGVTSAFAFLEETAHPSVSYQTADFNAIKNTLSIAGIASSYETLASQLALISQDSRVESAVIEDSSTTSRGVQFTINVTLKHEIFKF